MEQCKPSDLKKYTTRLGPPYPANDCPNQVKIGNDGKEYKSVSNKNGIFSWKEIKSENKNSHKNSNSNATNVSKLMEDIISDNLKLEYKNYSKSYDSELDNTLENLILTIINKDIEESYDIKISKLSDLYEINLFEIPHYDSLIDAMGNELIVHYAQNDYGIFLEAYMAPGDTTRGAGIYYNYNKKTWLFLNHDEILTPLNHEKIMRRYFDWRKNKTPDGEIFREVNYESEDDENTKLLLQVFRTFPTWPGWSKFSQK